MSATKILLIDDHPIVRKGLADVIEAGSDFVVCGEADSIVTALAEFDRTWISCDSFETDPIP